MSYIQNEKNFDMVTIDEDKLEDLKPYMVEGE